MTEDPKWFPDEHLELHFVMESEDSFTVDKEMVEVTEAPNPDDYRAEPVKQWVIADGDLERRITEDEVVYVIPTLKEKHRDIEEDEELFKPYMDEDDNLPTPWEDADPEDEP